MAAARVSLRNVSKKLSPSTTQLRNLHMTGPAEFLSPLLTTARSSVNAQQQPEDVSSKRPSPSKSENSAMPPTTRRFNTSRQLKAVRDTSTIDFAYLPDFDPDLGAPAPKLRVPLLPTSNKTVTYAGEVDEAVIRPEISLAAASGTHITAPSAFSDVTDNTAAADIDFAAMADRVATKAKETAGAVLPEQDGMVRQVWDGLVDDIFGPASKSGKTA